MNHDIYRVTISHEEPWWVAVVDGVGTTRAKKITVLEDMIPGLIMATRDPGKPDFDLVWAYHLPADAAEALKDYLQSRWERNSRHLRSNAAQPERCS